MRKNTKKNLIIASLVIVVFSIILSMVFIEKIGMSVLTEYGGTLPAYASVRGTSSLVCSDSVYDKQFLPYLSKTNIKLVSTREEIHAMEDDNSFNFYVFDTNGKSPRGLSTIQKVYQLDEGIPPNEKCDGTKDCLFGFSENMWEYNSSSDLCVILHDNLPIEEKSDYFRFLNNSCNSIKLYTSEKTPDDYVSLEECQLRIVKPINLIPIVAGSTIAIFLILVLIIFLARRK